MLKIKVLVTGAKGQFGYDVVNYLENQGYEVHGLGRQELDITNLEQVTKIFNEVKPNIVIHGAANTKVDLAESEPKEAFLVNAYGTRNVAVASEKIGASLVYISTDYVFNGKSGRPYTEFDQTDPLGIYGKSKLAGEQFVRDLHSRFFIVRTSWVYGGHGNNFVKTMLKLAQDQKKLSVVYDQIGSPTYTIDLARCIHNLIKTEKFGIYHVSNSGSCSWFEFAKAIFEEIDLNINVVPITTEEFPRPAMRPAYSVFEHLALNLNGFEAMRHWREALSEFIRGIDRNMFRYT